MNLKHLKGMIYYNTLLKRLSYVFVLLSVFLQMIRAVWGALNQSVIISECKFTNGQVIDRKKRKEGM